MGVQVVVLPFPRLKEFNSRSDRYAGRRYEPLYGVINADKFPAIGRGVSDISYDDFLSEH